MTLYLPDLVGLGGFIVQLAYCVLYGAQMTEPVRIFEMMAVSLLVLGAFRITHQSLGAAHPFRRVADWWVALALLPFYLNLNQIIDAARRPLMDQFLIAMDERILGVQPAIWFSGHQSPWLTEYFFFAYCSYFGLVVLTGVVLARLPSSRAVHAYIAAIALTFIAQNFGYILVPAVGPRFAQAHLMAAPLQGVFFSQYIESSFKNVAFLRDCFPSGHTGQSLVAMYFAVRYASKRYAMITCVCGISIIVATLYCQMHYAFDLMAAFVLAVFGVALCERLSKQRSRVYLPAFEKYALAFKRTK